MLDTMTQPLQVHVRPLKPRDYRCPHCARLIMRAVREDVRVRRDNGGGRGRIGRGERCEEMMWVCKVCGYKTANEPQFQWDVCPNCDNFQWMKEGERNDIQWTTAPPTEPGWYWVKPEKPFYNEHKDGVQVVYFDEPYASAVDDDCVKSSDEIAAWLGPLPVPEPPK
jgi:hypothetical protein